MRTVQQILAELESLGSEQTRKTYRRHGAPDSMFGVKVGDLKKVARTIKGQQQLAIDLYETQNIDAMYPSGIVAAGSRMIQTQLDRWAKTASWHMVAEYSVPGVAVENMHAVALANQWLRSRTESIACTGWCTYSAILATWNDDEIDFDEVTSLMDQIVIAIPTAPNRVRYTMNNFIISVGTYVRPLLEKAKKAAKKLGRLDVDMGDTACKVPVASEYIAKVESMNRVGKKRKPAKY